MIRSAFPVIGDEVATFLTQGVSVLVGSCDASRVPGCMRAVGLKLHDDRRHATVYLPESTSRHTVTNVAENPRIAILTSYPPDHRSLQLKGNVTRVASAAASDQAFIEEYLSTFGRVLELLGMPHELVDRISHWPSVALEFRIEELYVQTPGPGAGAKFAGQL